jgi:hypothetical protein
MSVISTWTAVISVPGQTDVHVEGNTRDGVVSIAMQYVPARLQEDILDQLSYMARWLWLLPSRTAMSDGVTVVVTKK